MVEIINTPENSYKNQLGDTVFVSDDHLRTAVRIKEELQKMSPTRRCSWVKHRQMMRAEGYDNSDSNENYRCLVKRYQKKIGRLPSVASHANLVAESKLEAIKQEIGHMNSAKLGLQEQARKVRKLIRDTNKDALLVEEIANALRKTDFVKASNPVVLPKLQQDTNKAMIVCLSDIHYGAHVDISENYYDPEVAAKLLDKYADEVIALIDKEDVYRVEIVNLGDIVEHAYMRNQNLYDSEQTLSEQIVNVTKLIINFIQKIRNHVEMVSYRGIAGNHDRMQGDKTSNLNSDHAVNVSNHIVEMWIELSGSDVDYIECDSYFADTNINGYNFAFIHGDRQNIKKKSTLAELGEQYDKHYDAVLSGHIHHNFLQEVGKDRYQVAFGSVKGMDDYSIKLGAKSSRSQGIVLVGSKGFEIRKVNL